MQVEQFCSKSMKKQENCDFDGFQQEFDEIPNQTNPLKQLIFTKQRIQKI